MTDVRMRDGPEVGIDEISTVLVMFRCPVSPNAWRRMPLASNGAAYVRTLGRI